MGVDLVIRDCRIVTPELQTGPGTGIAVDDGKIASIAADDHLPDADQVIDADGNVVVPGLIDDHIHTRDPGAEHKEDWRTVTRAAAAGGITSVIGMPNTDPFIETPEQLEMVYDIADEKAVVDFQSYALLTADNLDQIHPLAEAGAAGYKCFLAASNTAFPIPNDGELYDAMAEIAETGLRIGFHEENNDIIQHYRQKFQDDGRDDMTDHEPSRPVVAEEEAVQRVTLFAEWTGCPTHLFHVSSGSAAEAVAEGKRKDADVTAETLPQFLWFTADVIEDKGSIAKMNPPIRQSGECEKLWDVGVNGDGIDCIATDHAPHTEADKKVDNPFGDLWDATSGFVGLEAVTPAMLTFVNEDRLSMEKWVRMHSQRPAQIWGMYPEKGSLQVGTDADLTIVDPDEQWTLDRQSLQSKTKVTPFDGETFTGTVDTTIVRGNVVFEGGEVVGEAGLGELIDVDGE